MIRYFQYPYRLIEFTRARINQKKKREKKPNKPKSKIGYQEKGYTRAHITHYFRMIQT